MTSSTRALVTSGPGAPFEIRSIERRSLRDDDVLIDIAYAGICHSDIHTAREEWGGTRFPLVPGHEIAGTVAAVGSGVTRFAVGDRVGVGCLVDSCGECEQCLAGEEQFCLTGPVGTYNALGYDGEPTYGGYSRQVVVSERFTLRIPEGLPLDVAAPLLCAGITTWSPLHRWGAGPDKRVAVVGLGGLGHMAVKLAAAMGAEVEVLSRTDSKAAEAKALGATALHATGDADALRALRGRYDLVVNTVSADLAMHDYLRTLRPLGVLATVGLPSGAYQVPPGSLVGGSKVLAGSAIGGIRETQAMLDFCAAHGLGAQIETIGADRVDEAYDRVVSGDVRFRFVIDTSTLG